LTLVLIKNIRIIGGQREVSYQTGNELDQLDDVLLAIFNALSRLIGKDPQSLPVGAGAGIPRKATTHDFP
jgi:hypothetical protein